MLIICCSQVALEFLRQYQNVADEAREKLLRVIVPFGACALQRFMIGGTAFQSRDSCLASPAASKHCTPVWCHSGCQLDCYGLAVVQQWHNYAIYRTRGRPR
jgi:hypothetical protein